MSDRLTDEQVRELQKGAAAGKLATESYELDYEIEKVCDELIERRAQAPLYMATTDHECKTVDLRRVDDETEQLRARVAELEAENARFKGHFRDIRHTLEKVDCSPGIEWMTAGYEDIVARAIETIHEADAAQDEIWKDD